MIPLDSWQEPPAVFALLESRDSDSSQGDAVGMGPPERKSLRGASPAQSA